MAIVNGRNSGFGSKAMRDLAVRGVHVIATARTLKEDQRARS
jgi:NADP-dependent 3-hydroxy acid dehydrogenase YdfG